MLTFRNLAAKRVFRLGASWLLALGCGAVVAPACGGVEDCADTQTCIPGAEAGAGGEDNQGGTAGANGGSSGAGPSGGGSSGNEGGRGGSSTGGMAGMSGEGGEPTGGIGGGGDSGGEGGGPDPTDNTPPSIVSVSPEAGATGVRSNENIVITFSEAMDRATTEAAFESSELLPATFSWNGSSTVLTVNPVATLVYAEGAAPSIPAREYMVTLTNTAEDRNGNQLADALTWSFHTLRRITHTIPIVWSNILGVHTSIGAHNDCMSPASQAHAGDLADNTAEYILVSADISAMPAGATVESATLSGEQIGIQGDPYALGNLYAYATNVYPPSAANWGTTPISGSLVFSGNATLERKTVDVSGVLPQHYAERVQRYNLSQYRVQFDPIQSNNDNAQDQAIFGCGSFSLTAVYTVP
jgi:hypothetical protein